jgi:regulator of RNase E activity RraA
MVADILDEFGLDTAIPASALAPLAPGQRMVGQAVTSRHGPARNTVGHNLAHKTSPSLGGVEKVTLSEPGDVIVIDARSVPGVSNFGGIVATAAFAKKLSGVVVDGSVRDVESMRSMGLAVWARGATPRTGKYRAELIEFNGVVEIAGVQVRPGDLILGDSDGLVVVPVGIASAVLEKVLAAASKEKTLIKALADGASAKDGAKILPPSKW